MLVEAVSRQAWDYRWQSVPRDKKRVGKIAGDSSIMSYRGGHTVQHTLIRAYFSPAHTTAQRFCQTPLSFSTCWDWRDELLRYIYTGCARGGCVIYDVASGEMVRRLEGHNSCVRDVSWHPDAPELVTSSWDGLTAAWTYDERRKRCINPEAAADADAGDEDSEDAEGNPIIRDHLERMVLPLFFPFSCPSPKVGWCSGGPRWGGSGRGRGASGLRPRAPRTASPPGAPSTPTSRPPWAGRWAWRPRRAAGTARRPGPPVKSRRRRAPRTTPAAWSKAGTTPLRPPFEWGQLLDPNLTRVLSFCCVKDQGELAPN